MELAGAGVGRSWGWIIPSKGISSPSPMGLMQRFAKFSYVCILLAVERAVNYSTWVLMSSPHPGPMLLSGGRDQSQSHSARNRIAGILGGMLCFISFYFLFFCIDSTFCRKLQVHGNEISGREVTGIH